MLLAQFFSILVIVFKLNRLNCCLLIVILISIVLAEFDSLLRMQSVHLDAPHLMFVFLSGHFDEAKLNHSVTATGC